MSKKTPRILQQGSKTQPIKNFIKNSNSCRIVNPISSRNNPVREYLHQQHDHQHCKHQNSPKLNPYKQNNRNIDNNKSKAFLKNKSGADAMIKTEKQQKNVIRCQAANNQNKNTQKTQAFSRSSSQRNSVSSKSSVSQASTKYVTGNNANKLKTQQNQNQPTSSLTSGHNEVSAILCRGFESKTISKQIGSDETILNLAKYFKNQSSSSTQNYKPSSITHTSPNQPNPQLCQSYLQQTQLRLSPQLYAAYRTQNLILQHNSKTFSLRIYSKGRKQMKYSDGTIQVYYNGLSQIQLICWSNGDWKLRDGERVSFWSQGLGDFDQYYCN